MHSPKSLLSLDILKMMLTNKNIFAINNIMNEVNQKD